MAVQVNGKALAAERISLMRSFVRGKSIHPKLTALTVAPNIPTQQFLKSKKRVAEEIGIEMNIIELPSDISEALLCEAMHGAVAGAEGAVLQLPIPVSGLEAALACLPQDADPDCMGLEAGTLLRKGGYVVLPPVVAAIAFLCEVHHISVKDKKVVVVGQGRLVGAPAAAWFEQQGAEVVRLTKNEVDISTYTKNAEIIVLGAGVPMLLKPGMIQTGAYIFDAGTSEESGRVVGDADPACGEKAQLFTPVPGGIGPLAVAMLFENLLRLRFDYSPLK